MRTSEERQDSQYPQPGMILTVFLKDPGFWLKTHEHPLGKPALSQLS